MHFSFAACTDLLFSIRLLKLFEKLNWYGKLNLRLWGGERYCSQSSPEKVINSQNCKVAIQFIGTACKHIIIIATKKKLWSLWNREPEGKSDFDFGIEGIIIIILYNKVNASLWCSLHACMPIIMHIYSIPLMKYDNW